MLLPTSEQSLYLEIARKVVEGIQQWRNAAKEQYDRGAKQLPALVSGQMVQVQPVKHGEKWKKATVLKKVGERSYLVKTSNGQIYRRNRKYIKRTKEVTESDDTPHTEEDGEDEFCIPTTEQQIELTNQTNMPDESEMNTTVARNPPENCTSETTTHMTCTGQVIKPFSKYRDFMKL